MQDFWTGPVELPITGELDLHTFSPKEIGPLVWDYIEACIEKKIFEIRIIHGKGKGIQKKRVAKILAGHPNVVEFHPAPDDAGGWGATIAILSPASCKKNP